MESFLVHAGYGALILFAFIEAACIPIPSEITFGFAGVLAYQGHLNLALVIILGTLAELAGSYVSYAVGRMGGRPLVEKLGRYLLITRADLDRAERFATGKGSWAVPVGRALPFVRTFMSLVAGFIDFPAVRFGLLSLLGTAVYSTAIASIGYGVGSTWNSIEHKIADASYVIAIVVVLAIVAFFVHRLREVRREAREGEQGGPAHRRRSGTPLV
ncbi:MAG TPA: DedA family protein [Streptosporangiaceae bacterium]|jgi:membrane protein DedA with SNARE-associated domain